MKICNKKHFRLGLLLLAAAALLPLLHLYRSGSVNSVVWVDAALLLLLGVRSLSTSLDPEKAKAALIHDHDEREQQLALKHYRTAFWAGLVILFAVGSLLYATGSEAIAPLAVGFQLSAVLLLAIYRAILLLNL